MRTCTCTVLLLLVVWHAPATADETTHTNVLTTPAARAEFDRGLALFHAGSYEAAIVAFRDAYALERHPDLLWAQAQAERLSGDCASALVLYRQFIDSSPPERQLTVARKWIASCEQAVASTPAISEPRPAQTPMPPEETPPQPRRWDVTGTLLFATGIAGLGAGGALLWRAQRGRSAAADESNYDDFRDRLDAARRDQWIGIAAAGTGAALFTGWLIRDRLRARRSDERVGAGPRSWRATALVGSREILFGVSGEL